MKNVLIVTRHFPPVNNIAARRFGWMTRYFGEFGWRPFIVTTQSEGSLDVMIPEEQCFRIGENPQENAKVVKPEDLSIFTKNRFLSKIEIPKDYRFRNFDNSVVTWYPELKRSLSRLKKVLPPLNMIVGSYGPVAPLFFAKKLSEVLDVPWIADYRDLAAMNSTDYPFLFKRVDAWIEKKLLKSAGGVTSVSNSYSQGFHKKYNKPSVTVYNGFINRLKSSEKISGEANNSILGFPKDKPYLYHAGRLYEHRMGAVEIFLNALTRHEEIKFVFRSLGPKELEEKLLSYAKRLNIDHRIEILPPADPVTIDEEKNKALAAIVFEDLSRKKEYGEGFLTGKFLQLLPGTVPVLSICRPDNEMAEILKETSRGMCCSTTAQIEKFLNLIKKKPDMFQGIPEKVEKYNYRFQAKRMCGFMDSILE